MGPEQPAPEQPAPEQPADRDVQGRLHRLEARVAELESLVASPGAVTINGSAGPKDAKDVKDANDALDPDRFWALVGLKQRAGGESAVLFTGAVTTPAKEHFEWQQAFPADALLDTDWSAAADVLAALGHPIRLALLRQVLRGVRTVAELSSVEGFATTGQLYHHLRQLVAAGWLRLAGRGRYEVPPVRVVALLVILAAAQR